MGFGTSYSLVHVDCMNWVHTDLIRRIVRGILGTAIAGGVFYTFQMIPCNDNPTRFFFLFAFPALTISFFVFGVFPIICNKIGLVNNSGTVTYKTVHEPIVTRRSLSGNNIILKNDDAPGTPNLRKPSKFDV